MLHLDFETASELDVSDVGPWEYANHTSTEVLCAATAKQYGAADVVFALDRGWVERVWAAPLIHAHNAAFERCILNYVIAPRFGMPELPCDRFTCSAARAAELSLPRALANVAEWLHISEQKDMEGHYLMKKMCKVDGPRDAESFARLGEYCKQDVIVEREVEKKIRYNAKHIQHPSMRRLWVADQKINNRGFAVDRQMCENAVEIMKPEKKYAGEYLAELTSGVIDSPGQIQRMKKYFKDKYDLVYSSLDAAAIEKLVASDIPDDMRQILEIRYEFSVSSTAKYQTALESSKVDSRVRDTLLYCGANTGRFAGRRFQPHNLPRPARGADPIAIAETISHDPHLTRPMYGSVMKACKNAIRSSIVAGPGRILNVNDYSQIEARKLPWLCGEKWKLQMFCDYDAGKGPDPYVASYAKAFVMPVDQVTTDQRNVGKVMELAFGYQGAVGAVRSFAAIYRINILDMFEPLKEAYPWAIEQAKVNMERRRKRLRDSKYSEEQINAYIGNKKEWYAAETLKILWRKAHPKTVKYWYALEEAAVKTVSTGKSTNVRNIHFTIWKDFLQMVLPSGRAISYYLPKLKKGKLTYKRTWKGTQARREATYGGKLAENATQASSGCLLMRSIVQMDKADMDVTLTVHDEIVDEPLIEIAEERMKQAQDIMTYVPRWAKGLPLKVAGYTSHRYKKE